MTALKRSLEEEIKCPLCLSTFTDPRRLPCEHVFCQGCLELVIKKSRVSTLTCPVCRGEHQLPEQEFPKAYQVNRLIEMYQETGASSKKKDSHKSHDVKDLDYCAMHNTQPLDLYCETCKSSVCRDCALLRCSKENHKYDFKENVLKKCEEELDEALVPIKGLYERTSLDLEAVKSAEQKLVHKRTEKVRCVEAEFDVLDDILQQAKKQQISEIEDHFGRPMSQRKEQQEELLSSATKLKNLISSATLPSGKSFLKNYEKMAETISKLREFAQCHKQPARYLLEDVDIKVELPLDLKEYISQSISVCRQVGGSCVCLDGSNLSQFELLNLGELFQTDFSAETFSSIKINARLVNVFDGSSQLVSVSQMSSHTFRLSVTPLKRGRHKLYIRHGDVDLRGSPVSCTVAVSPFYFNSVKPLQQTLKNPIGGKCQDGLIYVFECSKGLTSMSNTADGLKRVKTIPTKLEGELLLHGDCIYVADRNTDHVYLYQRKNFRQMMSIGGRGSGRDCFSYPNGIRMSKKREIYVCDSNNDRIKVFDENLRLRRIFGAKGAGPGQFKFPTDLEFDHDGNIYVVEFDNHRVQVLSAQEKHIRYIGNDITLLRSPVTAAMYRGFVFVSSFNGNCICVFTKGGEFVTSFGHNILNSPESVSIDQDGYVFVTNGKELLRF